jgi:hypothetical protein
MRFFALTVALLLLSGFPARADVKVSLKGGKMDIVATKATVKEILDRVASVTGMKVIYDGPVPVKAITKSVPDRTPANAVLGILEGEGINFAVILSQDGTKVETLLVTGPSKARPAPAGPAGMPPAADTGWAVEVDEPPPPPPPPGDPGAPPAPPADAAAAGQATSTPPPITLATPTPYASSPFTPQGAGPILLPPPYGTPAPR